MSDFASARPNLTYTVDEPVGEAKAAARSRNGARIAANLAWLIPVGMVLLGFVMRIVLRLSFNLTDSIPSADYFRAVIAIDGFIGLVGVACAFIALFGGFIGRGLLGLLLNGLTLAGALFLSYLYPVILTNQQLVGQWTNPREQITLNPDMTAEITVTRPRRVTFTGKWLALPRGTDTSHLSLVFHPSNPAMKDITWPIVETSDAKLTLNDNGPIDFDRIKK